MSEWQPIETAPKDGTHILLFCTTEALPTGDPWRIAGEKDFSVCEVGYWDSGQSEWHRQYVAEPTHWMHLPKPPRRLVHDR